MKKSAKIAIAVVALVAVVAVGVGIAVSLTSKDSAKLEVKVIKEPCELKADDGVDAIRPYISVTYVDGDGKKTEIDAYELAIKGETTPKSGDNTLVVTYTVNGEQLTQTATIFVSLVAMPAPEPTLTFMADGEIVDSYKYSPYGDISEPEVPEKTGYIGEWEDYVLTGSDVTVNAVYTPKQYVVTLDFDSALGGTTQEFLDVTYGKPITLPTPEKTGYTFAGWYYDEIRVADGSNWMIDDKNAVLSAQWITDSYTVTFVADDRTVKVCTYTQIDKVIDEPAVPTKAGYAGAWEPYQLNYGNITVRAIYTAIPYTVTFVAESATVGTQTYTVENKVITEPAVPAKTGYVGSWEYYTLTSGDLTVNAVYTAKQYTVTLNYDGATGGNTQQTATVTYDQTVGTLPTPEKTGYNFVGWRYKNTTVTAFTTWTFDDANVEFVAQWSTDSYSVTFVADDKTVAIESYTVENTHVTEPAVPAKTGYSGVWESYTLTSGNVTVHAIYTAITYTVTFVADDATVATQTYTVENKVITEPNVPAKTGYTGAWEEYALTTSDLTVNAVYTAKEYIVTLNYDGATGGDTQKTLVVTYDQEVGTLPTPTQSDYRFEGWFYNDTEVTTATVWTNDVTDAEFTAKWSAVEYTVTFVAGDITVDTQTYTVENKKITEPDVPEKTGYVGKWLPYSLISGDVRVEAMYTPKSYLVFLFYDGATGGNSQKELTAIYNQPIGTLPTPEKAGYAFDGWEYNGSIVTSETVWTFDVTGNSTFTAKWTQEFYTVTFDTDGGSAVENLTDLAYGSTITEPTAPIKDGYEFVGWFSDGALKNQWDFATDTVTANTTLYAKWINYLSYLTFTLNTDRNSYNVKGSSLAKTAATIVIPSEYNGKPVTRIYGNAFEGCSSLTVVTIPHSIDYIANKAFSNCSNLKTVNYNGTLENWCNIYFNDNFVDGETGNPLYYGAELYVNGEKITDLVVPETVTEVKDYAFYGCSSIRSVTLHEGVKKIGKFAFADCGNLKYNEYDNAYYLGNDQNPYLALIYTKTTEITACAIHSNTKVIASKAFYGCGQLSSITIPSGMQSVNSNAFGNCGKLTRVNYEGTIAGWCDILVDGSGANPLSNGADLYVGSNRVTNLSIPNTVTELSAYAFDGCTSLTSVIIPSSVTTVGLYAFYKCSNLVSMTIPKSITNFSTIIDGAPVKTVEITGGTEIVSRSFSGCDTLTSVTIPTSVTSIANSAFKNCSQLASIEIPTSVTAIGNSAFENCSSLTSITVPKGVKTIGTSAFAGCSGLISATVPTSVTSIGKSAFAGCNKLESITLPFAGASKTETTNTHFGYIFGANSYTDNATAVPTSLKTVDISAVYSRTNTYSIGSHAFDGCSGITGIKLSNVLGVGDYAFYSCTNLTEITTSSTVGTVVWGHIGSYAFANCGKITSFTIPDGVSQIGDNAFYNCTKLSSVEYVGTTIYWNEEVKKGNNIFVGTAVKKITCSDGTVTL